MCIDLCRNAITLMGRASFKKTQPNRQPYCSERCPAAYGSHSHSIYPAFSTSAPRLCRILLCTKFPLVLFLCKPTRRIHSTS